MPGTQDAPRSEFLLVEDWRFLDFSAAECPENPDQLRSLEDQLWTRSPLPAGGSMPSEPTVRWCAKTFENVEAQFGTTARLSFPEPAASYQIWLDGERLEVDVAPFGLAAVEVNFADSTKGEHELLVRLESEPGSDRRFGLDGVWSLRLRPALHLADDGFAAAGWCSPEFDSDTAPCRLSAKVVNGSDLLRRVRVHFVCRRADGRVLADVISAPAELPAGAVQVFEVEPPWDGSALLPIGAAPLEVDVELVEYAQVVDRRRVPFVPRWLGFEPRFGRFEVNGELRLLRGAVLDPRGSLAEQSDRALLRDLRRLAQLGLDLVVVDGRRETLLDRVDAGGPLVVQRLGRELVPGAFLSATGVGDRLAFELLGAPLEPAAADAGDSAEPLTAPLVLEPGTDRGDGAAVMAAAAGALAAELDRVAKATAAADGRRGPALLLHRAGVSTDEQGGLLDAWRTPSFAAQLVRSQKSVEEDPICYPAVAWSGPLEAPLQVYSNAEQVRVFVNGVLRAEATAATPGARAFPPSEVLPHPPYVFEDLAWEPGELRVVGYRDGAPVAERTVRTPGEPASIALIGETLDLPLVADGTDAIYVHAVVLDASGAVCTNFDGELLFQAGGRAALVGPRSVRARSGLATAAVRAGTRAGAAQVAADIGALTSPTLKLVVLPPDPATL